MTRITTHVLDTSAGRPAAGITVRPGRYRLLFETGAWFQRAGQKTIYPEIFVAFEVEGAMTHCHLPLLLAPYGYSTYRGS